VPAFLVDSRFPSNKKLAALPARRRSNAITLWLFAGCYCRDNLLDGVIVAHHSRFVRALTAHSPRTHRVAVADLVDAGLWSVSEDETITFHDWADYQESAAKHAKRQEKWREYKRSTRGWDSRMSEADSDAESAQLSSTESTEKPEPTPLPSPSPSDPDLSLVGIPIPPAADPLVGALPEAEIERRIAKVGAWYKRRFEAARNVEWAQAAMHRASFSSIADFASGQAKREGRTFEAVLDDALDRAFASAHYAAKDWPPKWLAQDIASIYAGGAPKLATASEPTEFDSLRARFLKLRAEAERSGGAKRIELDREIRKVAEELRRLKPKESAA
jgi:hypothetical protein